MENLIKMDDLGVPGFGGLEISPEPVVYNPWGPKFTSPFKA